MSPVEHPIHALFAKLGSIPNDGLPLFGDGSHPIAPYGETVRGLAVDE